jgi:hypothetical protein
MLDHFSVRVIKQQSVDIASPSIIPDALSVDLLSICVAVRLKVLLCMTMGCAADEATDEANVQALAMTADVARRRTMRMLLKSTYGARGIAPPR